MEASEEQLRKVLYPKGEKLDVDKEVKDMNAEERAVFNCLQDEDNFSAYEDIEDDWIIEANEGQVAVVPVEQEQDDEPEEEEGANKDVHVFEDKELMTEEEIEMEEYRKKVVAMLPSNLGMPANFAPDSEVAPQLIAGQAALDAGFEAFMQGEYNENQIGELDEDLAPDEDEQIAPE